MTKHQLPIYEGYQNSGIAVPTEISDLCWYLVEIKYSIVIFVKKNIDQCFLFDPNVLWILNFKSNINIKFKLKCVFWEKS